MVSVFSMFNFFVALAYWWWFKWDDVNVVLCFLG
jgi:hypothetical protein